jgi:CMP-N,N'-diacetyllegionaminic acid synthase
MKKNLFSNNVWALIPARSGSKGIKNKNLQKIGKDTLVAKTIKISKKCKFIQRIFLSTDSEKIKKEGLKHNVEIPFLRSKKNSRDKSTDYDVVNEFLNKIKKIEKIIPKYILYLRPTSPFRNASVIDKAIKKIKSLNNYDSLVSVHAMNEPVHKKFYVKNKKLKPIFSYLDIDKANEPRQNFTTTYTANGYLDIIKIKNVLDKKKYLNKNCYPFIVPETIDIDNKFDLKLANFFNKKKYV